MGFYSKGKKAGRENILLKLYQRKEKSLASALREDKTADVSALLPPPSAGKKKSPDEIVFLTST